MKTKQERAAVGIAMLGAIENLAELYSVEVGGSMDAGAQQIVKLCKKHSQRLLAIYDAPGMNSERSDAASDDAK